MQVIPSNTATAALRRIAFTLVDATDLITPEDITVTGVKADLSIAGGTPVASTNDIVKVDGADGEYYLELTQAEANQSAGSVVRGWLTPSGCALTKFVAQIGPAGVMAEPISAAAIADSVWDEATSGHTAAGSFGKATADILEDTATTLPAALTTIDTEVGVIDGLVDAIKAKTDALTFTVSGQVDANVQSINDTALQGNGTSGTPWAPV